MGKCKHNWQEIENRYVTGKESYSQVAEIFKVSKKTVTHYGKEFMWGKKRRDYQEGLKAKLIAKAQDAVALDKSQFDEKTNRVCDVIAASMALKATVMAEYLQGEKPQVIPSKEAMDMLSIIRQAQEIKYRTLGVADKHEVKGDIKTITELSMTAQTMVDKVMGTPETRAAMAMALVPLKQGGEVRAGGNGKDSSSGDGSGGADGSDTSDD